MTRSQKIVLPALLIAALACSQWLPAQTKPGSSQPARTGQPARPAAAAKTPAAKMTMAQLKTAIEKSGNSPLYVKDVLKKKFSIDTITIFRTQHFAGLADSIAYHGAVGKVYGPFEKGKILVQVLDKAPNRFNHIAQLYLDTSLFRAHFADSLATSIMERVHAGKASFKDMVRTYSSGGETAEGGDMGWMAKGSMIPAIEKELSFRKKGELFKVWTPNGVHIIQKLDDAKEDHGYALLMRIFL